MKVALGRNKEEEYADELHRLARVRENRILSDDIKVIDALLGPFWQCRLTLQQQEQRRDFGGV